MRVADAMSREVLLVASGHSLRDACRLMAERNVGAAVVHEEHMPGPGIVTERDVLRAVARGADPETISVADVMTFEAQTATVSWDLDAAAEEMVRRGFRHLVVVDDAGKLAGILSMRDVVRAGMVGKLPAG
ncbi:MAG TPA: CBS domain-containing protein [Candidatus Angelobacter sp.]|jgi:CBS domain-containing protein|nr:CBS domain-containing protein [Candidatus Angelobacter sp.]